MRSRFTRLAVLAVGVLGLVATSTPPAQSYTVGSAVYIADVTVQNGIGYPITTLPTPTTNVLDGSLLRTLAHAFGGTHTCLPLQDLNDPTELTNCHWRFDHPSPVTVNHVICEDVLVNINKNKPPVHPPGCTFRDTPINLPNEVTGHCGLSGGQLGVRFTDGLGNTYILDIHFQGIGGLLLISGHWRNNLGQHGLIISVAAALPPVDPVTPGQSCANKTARDFVIVGSAVLFTSPTLTPPVP